MWTQIRLKLFKVLILLFLFQMNVFSADNCSVNLLNLVKSNISTDISNDNVKFKKLLKLVAKYEKLKQWDIYDIDRFIYSTYAIIENDPRLLKTLFQSSKERTESTDQYFRKIIQQRIFSNSLYTNLKNLELIRDTTKWHKIQSRLDYLFQRVAPIMALSALDFTSTKFVATIYIPEVNLLRSTKFHQMIFNMITEKGEEETIKFLNKKFKNKAILHQYTKAISSLNKYFFAFSITYVLYNMYDNVSDNISSVKDELSSTEKDAESKQNQINQELEKIKKILKDIEE